MFSTDFRAKNRAVVSRNADCRAAVPAVLLLDRGRRLPAGRQENQFDRGGERHEERGDCLVPLLVTAWLVHRKCWLFCLTLVDNLRPFLWPLQFLNACYDLRFPSALVICNNCYSDRFWCAAFDCDVIKSESLPEHCSVSHYTPDSDVMRRR